MAWVYLIIAGVLEIAWAVGMKESKGFTRLWPSVLTIIGLIVSFGFLALALKSLPIGTAYAIWTGIGAAGTAILGIIIYAEPASAARIGCVALIILGIIGLKVTSSP